jgi:hypothetical protein
MSGSIEGFAAGILGLSLFEAVLSSNAATGRVGGVFTAAANLIAHIASPDVPAIPDLRVTTTNPGTAAPAAKAPGAQSAGVRSPIHAPTKYGNI